MLEVGIELAKSHFKLLFQQIQNFIDMNQIVASGPFLQVFLEEVCFEKKHVYVNSMPMYQLFILERVHKTNPCLLKNQHQKN